jgi:hypothetical protein
VSGCMSVLLRARVTGTLSVRSGMLNGTSYVKRWKPLCPVDAATSTREVFAKGL